jgi:hypothetical protein
MRPHPNNPRLDSDLACRCILYDLLNPWGLQRLTPRELEDFVLTNGPIRHTLLKCASNAYTQSQAQLQPDNMLSR